MQPKFDDSKWPQAFEYLDQEVGIMGVPGYWRYPEAFIGGRWIWTISLVFDNTVLLRKTVHSDGVTAPRPFNSKGRDRLS